MFASSGYYATTWNNIGTLKVYATNIDNIIATKSSNSNVVEGKLIT